MTILDSHPALASAFERLARVSLNPRRHTASDARAHSLDVAAMARRLGEHNRRDADDIATLGDLGLIHDIGKITGTAAPARSLDVLADAGVTAASHPRLHALVKWHDTNLPWWRAAGRGQGPSDRAWRRLAAAVDVDLLCLFMVADRVDAPGGWLRNAPLCWFLDQARQRGLVGDLTLHLPGHPSETSAGGVLVAGGRALIIRPRGEAAELPKGGIEFDELPAQAAVRETREEADIDGPLTAGAWLGHVTYAVGRGADRHDKRVDYFRLDGDVDARAPHAAWVTADEIDEQSWVNPALASIVRRGLLVVALDAQDATEDDRQRRDAG